MEFTIRPISRDDVPSVTNVHLKSFAGFFLTFLGERFVHVMYEKTLDMPESFGFVALNGAEIAGFVVGVTSQTSLYRYLLTKHWAAFAWASAGAVVRKPAIIPRLLRAIRKPAETKQSAADCLLMNIAVLPECQGHHIGQRLIRSFVVAARQRGVEAISLVTDQLDNDAANHFYLSNGFRLAQSYVTAEGRHMNEYMMELA
jgi:ribosomal protein S18 acetylase RimI-like enzyme